MRITKISIGLTVASLVASWLTPISANAGVEVTVEAAGVETSPVSGVTTETFDGFTPGTYTSLNTAVGTITSPGFEIQPADIFGGAGGTGNYFAVGAESGELTATLTLSSPSAYFGAWLSAFDPSSSLQFLSSGTTVATLNSSSTIFSSLGSTYFGNPSMEGADPVDRFVYANFIGTDGTTFNQIVFSQSNLQSGNEADNFSVAVAPPTTTPGTPVPGGVTSPVTTPAVPLPAAVWPGLILLGAVTMFPTLRARHARAGAR